MNRTLLLSCVFLLLPIVQADDFKTTAADQSALALTVYNGGRALVRDERRFTPQQATWSIAFMDVAEKIMPQTVAIDGLEVLEQNYDYDLLSPQALIDKNIGNTVRLARRSEETGETLEWTRGTILSTNGGIVLRMQDGSLETLVGKSNYHMVFDDVPDNLRTSPTLSLRLARPVAAEQSVRMTYLTHGLSWQSDYVLQLDKSESSARLDSWITLNNQSGIGYDNARLQLLAGDVNIQQAPPVARKMESLALQAGAVTDISEQALHGYHLYTVPHATTIRNRQSKQIKLFSASAVPVHKKLLDRAYVNVRAVDAQKSKPDQWLEFTNSKPALGLPVPQGTVRVYATDDEGNEQFIGEDRIDHTAVNDELKIRIGKAFDQTVERKTTRFDQLSRQQQQFSREIRINNGAEHALPLTIEEIMPAQEFRVLDSSHAHKSSAPAVVAFEVDLPASQALTIRYSVEVTYP